MCRTEVTILSVPKLRNVSSRVFGPFNESYTEKNDMNDAMSSVNKYLSLNFDGDMMSSK